MTVNSNSPILQDQAPDSKVKGIQIGCAGCIATSSGLSSSHHLQTLPLSCSLQDVAGRRLSPAYSPDSQDLKVQEAGNEEQW
jgi:hypothetical protein